MNAPQTRGSRNGLTVLQFARALDPSGGISRVALELSRRLARAGLNLTTRTLHPPHPTLKKGVGEIVSSPVLSSMIKWIPAGHMRLLFEVPIFTFIASFLAFRERHHLRLVHNGSIFGDIFVAHSCHRGAIAAKNRAGRISWLFYPLHWFLLAREALVFRRKKPPILVAISRDVANEYKRHYRLPDERIVYIPNGVDTSRFKPADDRLALRETLGLPPDSFLVLFVGNEFERKGLRYAIEGIAACGAGARILLLVIGGDNPEPFRDSIRALGIDDRVRFLGRIDPIENHFASADLLLLLSDYEPFGLVGLEALSSGLPLVSTCAGGIGEYMRDGKNGLVVKRNGEAVAEALTSLMADKELRQTLSRNARDSAAAFDWTRIADQYLALFEKIHMEKNA